MCDYGVGRTGAEINLSGIIVTISPLRSLLIREKPWGLGTCEGHAFSIPTATTLDLPSPNMWGFVMFCFVLCCQCWDPISFYLLLPYF